MLYLCYIPENEEMRAHTSVRKEKEGFPLVAYKNLEMFERFCYEDRVAVEYFLYKQAPLKKLKQFKKWREENPYSYGLDFYTREEIENNKFLDAFTHNDDIFEMFMSMYATMYARDFYPIRIYYTLNKETQGYQITRTIEDWVKNRKEVYFLYDKKTDDFYFSLRKEKQMRVIWKYPTVQAAKTLGKSDYFTVSSILASNFPKEETIKNFFEWRKKNPHIIPERKWNKEIEDTSINFTKTYESLQEKLRAVVE